MASLDVLRRFPQGQMGRLSLLWLFVATGREQVVTMSTGFPPVAVFAPVRDIGLLGGISTGEGKGRWWEAPHAQKRSK